MLDSSRALEEEDKKIIDHIGRRKTIVLLNKQDKGAVLSVEEIKTLLPEAVVLESTLVEGAGIDALAQAIESMVYGGEVSQGDNVMVTNVRHKNLLDEGNRCISDALSMIETRQPLEFIEIDVNRCYEALGEIIGETASDIIDKVFERFCLGK